LEDSLKGIIVAFTMISLFITCIINFIIIFPQEEGISFSDPQESSQYLTMQSSSVDTVSSLETLENQSQTGFNQWDITQGFMGSNSIKQSSKEGVSSYSNNIFTNIRIMSTQLFGANSPILYAIGIFSALLTIYLIYMVIKFVRTGL
jgi:hypothetical protein